MSRENIIGRQIEINELEKSLQSERSELIIVYGRRRVGKTYLIEEYFSGNYDFSFVGGHKLPQKQQLRNFSKALKAASGSEKPIELADWYDAFDRLEDYLASLPDDRKKVIFFDEMPWIDTFKSDFTSAFENFWNSWAARRKDIVFIATGSATSWMVDKLIDNPGGLHARITRHIYVRPFTLAEVEQYLLAHGCNWDRYQIAQCYMFFGGIPFYLSLLDTDISLAQNVDRLCFARGGALRKEFEELYVALFSHAENYIEVVKTLSEHRLGLTYSEISAKTKVTGNKLTRILKNLEYCDFIMKFKYFGKKSKDRIYRICDFYTIFYYKFIEPNLDNYDENWWQRNGNSRSVESWQGFAFELLCLTHIPQIRKALEIGGVATDISAWFEKGDRNTGDKGAQIDLIIDRADRITHLCEIKFSKDKYVINADYADRLRERMSLFRSKTGIKTALLNTFITTFGVADGRNASVVDSSITLDNLF